MGRISVIIPTFNRSDFLAESIKAILAQTFDVHQIIVVDDGSTDGTRAAVSAISGPIEYVYQPNAGKPVALNNGLDRCVGDFVWICDDDDLALPDGAKHLVKALQSNNSAGFAYGGFKPFYMDPGGKTTILKSLSFPDLGANSLLLVLLEDNFIFHNACLVRREAYDAVGHFRADLIRSEDYDMAIRLASRFDAVYVPQDIFLQRVHAGLRGSERDRFDESKQTERSLYYDKIVFRHLFEELPLDRFVPKGAEDFDADIMRRAALLQRSCLFFRRQLFEHSLSDMAEAVQMKEVGPPTDIEELICGRFLHPRYGCEDVVENPAIGDSLCLLAEKNEFGLSVLKAVTTPMLRCVRQAIADGRWRVARGFIMLLLRIHGYNGTLALAKRSLDRRVKAFGM